MKLRLTIFGVILYLGISSCGVYHPHTTDIPLISEKSDLRMDAGASFVPSVHASVSYWLTDKIAIQGFGSVGSDDRYYLQLAPGFYRNQGNNRILEIYGGFGYGYGRAYENTNPGHLFGDYQLYFGQINYGKIASKTPNLEVGFGLKTGYLHSNLTDQNYYDWESETGPYRTFHLESLLLEPMGFVRMGGEKLKVNLKLAGAMIYEFTHTDKSLPYSYFNLGLGLNYRL